MGFLRKPEKVCFLVNQLEFDALHSECIMVTEAYVREARKTSLMLGRCMQGPLTFRERFALLSQEILEKDACAVYLAAKRLLHSTALLGYESVPTTRLPEAQQS
jgi:hypothetical protein